MLNTFENTCVQIFILTNGRSSIKETIDSIFKQDYEDWSIVVSDNSNSEQTKNICLKYSSSKIKYIGHQTNLGTAGNLNYCLSVASSKYFVLMHDDDYFHEKYLNDMLKKFTDFPSARWGFSNAVLFSDGLEDKLGRAANSAIKNNGFYKAGVDSFKEIIGGDVKVIMPSVMYRNDIDKKIVFDIDYVAMGDMKMWLSLSLRYDFIYIEKPIFYYRIGNQNHSLECAEKGIFFSEALNLLNWIKELIDLGLLNGLDFEIIKKSMIKSHCKILLWNYAKTGKFSVDNSLKNQIRKIGGIWITATFLIIDNKFIRQFVFFNARILKFLMDKIKK